MSIKTCKHCGVVAEDCLFEAGRNVCKSCRREQARKRSRENIEHIRAKRKEYEIKNAEKIAERKRAWYEVNKEDEVKRMKKWRDSHVEHRKEYAQNYNSAHVEENKARQRAYRQKEIQRTREAKGRWVEQNPMGLSDHRRRFHTVRRLKAFNENAVIDRSITLKGVLDRDQYVCHICGEKIEEFFTHRHPLSAVIDHLFPIAFGGQHTWDNVGIAHFSCNARMKHSLQIP